MPSIDYDGRYFRPIFNSGNGQVACERAFHYRQTVDLRTQLIPAEEFASVRSVGGVHVDSSLGFVYQHFADSGELRTGRRMSLPELLPDGRIRLHEDWQWTSGDHCQGQSIIEEPQPKSGLRLRSRSLHC